MTDQQIQAIDQALFNALLFSLHAACMQQLGKIVNPMNGEIERDLEQAQATIEMMEMLRRKTTGNLSETESKLLGRLLYELQMNYVDEAKKEGESGTKNGNAGKTTEGDSKNRS
jgi:hypothetical protein